MKTLLPQCSTIMMAWPRYMNAPAKAHITFEWLSVFGLQSVKSVQRDLANWSNNGAAAKEERKRMLSDHQNTSGCFKCPHRCINSWRITPIMMPRLGSFSGQNGYCLHAKWSLTEWNSRRVVGVFVGSILSLRPQKGLVRLFAWVFRFNRY